VPNMLEIIKQAAVEAVKVSNPCAIMFGKVISISPLKINVEQRLTLDESHLVLTSLVRDFSVDMTVDHTTEYTSGGSGESSFESHNHAITGKKTFQVHLGLKINEYVMLLQMQGGQKYIVVDRVVI
jgi:Protein of unknown function (DUF2577).